MHPRDFFKDCFPTEAAIENLSFDRSKALSELISCGEYGGAKIIECRRDDKKGELVILEIKNELGQAELINDIRGKELVAIVFPVKDAPPSVYPLREDFPDVPHLNAAPKPIPRSLCLYDIHWHEVKRDWTALNLVERIRWWMTKIAHGELHGDNQPLDPIFLGGEAFSLVVPEPLLVNGVEGPVAAVLPPEDDPKVLFLREIKNLDLSMNQIECAAIVLRTQPIAHGRLKYAPSDLDELNEICGDLGLVLVDKLTEALKDWAATNQQILNANLLVLIVIPLERVPDCGEENLSARAFVTTSSAGEVGRVLGVLEKSPVEQNEPAIKNQMLVLRTTRTDAWVPILVNRQCSNLSDIKLEMAHVHPGFGPALAAETSGVIKSDIKLLLIGAGALGSQLADTLIREGFGEWSIIDGDRLLPHNLARHALSGHHLGLYKSKALAWHLNHFEIGERNVKGLACDVLDPGDQKAELDKWLQEPQFIIDASASVSVERWLACDAKRPAPAMSIFFNPKGTELVLLSEGCQRRIPLDILEIEYYANLITDGRLSNHLAQPDAPILTSFSCREPSVKIPQSRVLRLVGRAADEVRRVVKNDEPEIDIWTDSPDKVSHISIPVPGQEIAVQKIEEWTVRIMPRVVEGIKAYRGKAGKNETGGVLVGSWDRSRKGVYIALVVGPPSDSVQESHSFIRGMQGLNLVFDEIHRRTGGNLTYAGEWHTHPKGCSSQPSGLDYEFIRKMREKTLLEDAPALMLIAGEDGVSAVLKTRSGAEARHLVSFQ